MKTNQLALLWKGILAIALFSLISPKWTFPLAAWCAPFVLLSLVLDLKPAKGFLVCSAILFVSGLVANYRVMPFPGIIFLIITLQAALLGALPYLVVRFFSGRTSGWLITITFPSAMVLYEYLTGLMGSGTWGSLAYTQADNVALMQVASVTGLWGVSFLLYGCNAVVAYAARSNWSWSTIKSPVLGAATLLVVVLLFGHWRINPYFRRPVQHIRVAGITALNLKPIGTMYRNAFGKEIPFDAKRLTQTSPELAELNKGLAAFVEDPLNERFQPVHKELRQFQDSLFMVAEREALGGTKLISFSEALMFTVKPIEDSLINKGRQFCIKYDVYLFLPVGSFIPGKIEFGKPYIENKLLIIDPSGDVRCTFFKNKPVPLVEGSVPGDGQIPIIETPFGQWSPSICYDADFPSLIRQAGKQGTEILVVPSGDWREISPYHSNMARVRAIENGLSILRPASGAQSVIIDPYGQVVARRDFEDDGDKIVVGYVPCMGITTLYSQLGDWLVITCALFLFAQVGAWIGTEIRFRVYK